MVALGFLLGMNSCILVCMAIDVLTDYDIKRMRKSMDTGRS